MASVNDKLVSWLKMLLVFMVSWQFVNVLQNLKCGVHKQRVT